MPSLPVCHALGTSMSAATPTNLARTRAERGPYRNSCTMDTPPSPGAQWAEGTPPVPSVHPLAIIISDSWPSFSGGKRPLLCIFIAKCLGIVPWD